MKSIIFTLLIFVTAGCATSTGPFVRSNLNTSCVKGDVPNVFNLFARGESFVYLKNIDGTSTQNPTYMSCTTPGKHEIEIMVENDNRHNYFYKPLEITFEPNTTYQIKVYKLENSWEVNLLNIRTNTMSVIGKFKLEPTKK